MPRLIQEQREQAIGMHQKGARRVQIAQRYGCTPLMVSRLVQRYLQTGTTAHRPRTGRPRFTTPQEDRRIQFIHLRNRFVTATATSATALGYHISQRTVLRRLRAAGIRSYRPFRGMSLTAQHRLRRLQLARRHETPLTATMLTFFLGLPVKPT